MINWNTLIVKVLCVFLTLETPQAFAYSSIDLRLSLSLFAAPVAENDEDYGPEDTLQTGDVSLNDYDPDGDPLTYSVLVEPLHGELILEPNGQYSYMPDPEYNGLDYATYQVCDPGGLCATALIEFGMTFVNDLPQANNDNFNAFQGSTLNENVSWNDIELDDEVNWWNILLPPAHAASFTFNIDGSFSYTPEVGYAGPDQFMYQACDPCGACDFAFVYITVLPPNSPPVAVDDYKYGTEDFVLNNQVHSNDSDPDGDALTFSIEVEPEHGVLILNANGTFSYTPDLDFYGNDYFTYNACDIYGLCDDAVVTLDIAFVNDWPVAVDDYEEIDEDEVLNSSVALNDYDLDFEILDYLDIYGPYHGTLTLNYTGTYTYTPDANYFGEDQFGYVCIDPCGITDFGDVFITINPINDLPVVIGESFVIDEDESIDADLSLNDSDIESAVLTYSVSEQANYGDVLINPDGTFSYIPQSNYFGNDGFSYLVSDEDGGSSEANVNIQVLPVNDAPLAENDSYEMDEDTQLLGDVASNDSDTDGDDLSFTFDTAGIPGSFVGEMNGEFLFIPNADFNGLVELEYEVCDSHFDCDFGLISIVVNPLNDAPVGVGDEFATPEGISLNGSVAENDFDVDQDLLTYALLTNPVNGILVFDANGSFTYTPSENFNGMETITYSVCDPFNACSQAELYISVLFVNDFPEPENDNYIMNEDGTLQGNVSLNDVEPDGEDLFYSIIQGPQNGVMVLNSNGTFTYTPETNFFGQEVMTYNACDPMGNCVSATITVSVNPINDAPVAEGEIVPVLMNTAVYGDVSLNDFDADNDILTYSIIQNTTNGIFELAEDGTYSYSPDFGFFGVDMAEYMLCDVENVCVNAQITFNVSNTNDAPVLADDLVTLNEDDPIFYDLSLNDFDPNGDALIFTVYEEPSNGSCIISEDGILTYEPELDFHGTIIMYYQACDIYDVCEIATITIEVLPVNDAPVASTDHLFINEDGLLASGLSPLVSDVDDSEFTFIIISAPEHGELILNADGSFTYQPVENYFGSDVIEYQVCDVSNACDVAAVNIDVLPVNDAPVAHDDVFTTVDDTELMGDISLNDYDVDSENLQFTLIDAPLYGLLILNTDGTFSYTPDLGNTEPDIISYNVCDEFMLCDIASITFSIEPSNTAPFVESINLESCALNSTIIDLSSYIGDAQTQNELLNISNVSTSYGSFNLDGQTLEISYDSEFSGIIEISYLVCDDGVGPLCTAGAAVIEVEAAFVPEIESSVITNVSCYNNANGSIEIDMPDDGVIYSIEWSNGEVTEDIFNLESGIYEVTINSDRNCQMASILNFEVTQPEQLNIVGLEAIHINENPGGSSDYEVSGGTEPYSYLWTDSEGNIISETESLGSLTDIEQQGTYSLLVTDANGCETLQTIIVTDVIDLNNAFSFITYPNPVEDQCNVVLSGWNAGLINADLHDMSGRLVQSTAHSYSGELLQLDLSNLSSGTYSLQISSGDFRAHTLVLVQGK